MTGRFVYLLCVLLALGSFVSAAQADLVGYWKFDEGSGATASDATDNHYDGTLIGALEWVEGRHGGALSFSSGASVDLSDHAAGLSTMSDYTVAFWVTGYDSESGQVAWSWSNGTNTYRIQLELHNGQIAHGQSNAGGWQGVYSEALDWDPAEWYHVVFQKEGTSRKGYRDGVELLNTNSPAGVGPADLGIAPDNIRIGALHSAQFFLGDLDDVQLYDEVLSEEAIQDVMMGRFELATDPSPADEAVDLPRDTVLGWTPGDLAVTHDVYFGTVFEEVSEASRADSRGVLVSQDQSAETYDPEGLLEFGQTSYWRIDEVNAAPDNTLFKGEVWSFTAEPVAYPVENIIATGNAAWEGGSGPEKTVDGSGLDAKDQHSTSPGDMCVGAPTGNEPVHIQYEFDKIYKLCELKVWNYNLNFELMFGFGFKDVTIEYSENGADWTILTDVQFAQATARTDYAANTVVDIEGVAARYVRLTANSGYGSMGQYGLSEVRFLYSPVEAREPQPADGATDVAVDTVLDWRAGREAISHEVYLGMDPEALALTDTVSTNSYTPEGLDLAATYYWKINEVQEVEFWEGDIWSFSTQAYAVIDDFESYTDDIDTGKAIFQTWIDGWENDTGSTVGHLSDPFAERTIVHNSRQSMPLFYDNAGLTTAETEYTFAAQDWTASGIQSLSLYFYGAAGNDGQLYVKINDAKVDYDGDAADITAPLWQAWNIDLSSVGSLADVTMLTIGIEGAGATGVLYIDDIRLYPKVPEYVTPTEPDTAGLVGHYAFDGNANDSSGHGFNGREDGGPTYGAGVDGQALKLDGFDDYVVVGSVGISGAMPRTIAGWIKADTLAITDWTSFFGFTSHVGTSNLSFDMNKRNGDQYCIHVHGWEGDIMTIDLEWHHLAATYDGTTIARYGDGRFVGSEDRALNTEDHVQMGKRAHDAGGNFPGSIDDVRIYDRALSGEEVAWLAGRRMPAHKPF